MQEQERAEDTLQRGLRMKDGNLDAYIAEYKMLIEMAGYDPNSRLALKLFTDGLPAELYKDVLRLDRPRNFQEWKTAALERHTEWLHLKHRLEQKKGVRLFNPFATSFDRRPRTDPNAMDTSADRGRIRRAEEREEEEEEANARLHQEGDPNRGDPKADAHYGNPPYKPREGFLKRRWEMKDKWGVQCYNCQKYGHITKECFQKQRKPRPESSTKARRTHEESNDEAKEEANTILRTMGGASERAKGYIARTIGENFRGA